MRYYNRNFKLHWSICCWGPGEGPGGSLGGASSDGGMGGTGSMGGNTGGGSGGNVGPGLATGFGHDGYGLPSEGQPGIFGGGVLGGIPGLSHGDAVAAAIAAAAAAATAAASDSDAITADIASGLGMAAASSGNLGDASAFGAALGNAMVTGQMTADQANLAVADAGLSFGQTVAANFAGMSASLPAALSVGLGMLGMPVTTGMGFAAVAAALSGQGAFGSPADASVDGGPDYQDLIKQGQAYVNTNGVDLTSLTTGTTPPGDDDTDGTDDDLWDQFVSKVTTDLEGAVKDNTDFIAGEASAYNTATTGATDKANSVLNQLASDLKSGTGTFTPTNTKWGNYQPGSNFITAKSLASLAGQSMNNTISAAASTYANAPDRSPAKGVLAYLAALQGVAAEDKTFSIGEQELAIKQYLAENKVADDQADNEAAKPGVLSNIGSVIDLGTSLANIGSTLKLW